MLLKFCYSILLMTKHKYLNTALGENNTLQWRNNELDDAIVLIMTSL